MGTSVRNLPNTAWVREERARGLLRRVLDGFRHWLALRRSRLRLSELTEEQLRDIGVTRSEAMAAVYRSWIWVEDRTRPDGPFGSS